LQGIYVRPEGRTLQKHEFFRNQAGSITGSYLDAEEAQHGFVRNPYGTITSFDPPRGGNTTATSINDSGVIAGSYYYDWNAQTAEGFCAYLSLRDEDRTRAPRLSFR
jgi:hypothetical protein